MRIRLYLKYQHNAKYYIEGEVTKAELIELNTGSCATITMGKVTVKLCEIWGWEVFE